MSKISIGDRFLTKCGWCEVIEYINNKEIVVIFDDTGYKNSYHAKDLRQGSIKDPFIRSVFEVGYLGDGPFSWSRTKKIYDKWNKMFERCYAAQAPTRNPTYIDCIVSKKFHCLQNFGYWYQDQYCSNIPNVQLDKDLLFKHNKIYSPNKCLLLPPKLNTLLIKADASRGQCCIGVTYCEMYKKPYKAQCSINKRQVYKYFNTEYNAFRWYKRTKESHIQEVTESYKNVLDPRAYNALMNYEVEITD